MAVALVLLALVCAFFGLLHLRPRLKALDATVAPDRALEASLATWSNDLKTFAIALHLGRWNDVRYAMRWDTLGVPDSVFAAMDSHSVGDEALVLLSRMALEAQTLARTSVLIEHHYLLPSGQMPKDSTPRYSATDYARAVRMLCVSIDRAVASLATRDVCLPREEAAQETVIEPVRVAA